MMKIFVSNNVVLLILVITTTIDASRLFYLPLPKIHPSHQQIPEENNIQEAAKKSLSDEFVPPSAIEQEEIEKRGDTFDWEVLVDREASAKRRIPVNELLPPSLKYLEEQTENKLNDDSHTRHKQTHKEQWIDDSPIERTERLQSNDALKSKDNQKRRNDTLFIVIVGTCCVVGVVGLLAAATFWYKVQKRAKEAADSEYPSYGVTGPNASGGSKMSPSSTMSDRKLAQSAQMYHYQQQRQQMMAQEKAHLDAKPVHSDDSDDEAPGGGDYTVYECPGLAPTGEMEVRNPLFAEPDSSLTSTASNSHPTTNNHYPQPSSSPKERSLP